MNRYFNENPQVTYWREKTEKIEKELRDADEDYKSLAMLVSDMNNSMLKTDKLLGIESEKCKEVLEELSSIKKTIKCFNSFPWYKKMFYKFKI